MRKQDEKENKTEKEERVKGMIKQIFFPPLWRAGQTQMTDKGNTSISPKPLAHGKQLQKYRKIAENLYPVFFH